MIVVVVAMAVIAVLMMMIMVMVMMFMVVAMAFLTVLMVVMIVVVMLMLVAVVVSAGAFVLVYVEIDTGILHRMHHGMFQLSFVHIHYSGHEIEIRLFGGFQTVVVLHTDAQICQVEGYAFAVNGD